MKFFKTLSQYKASNVTYSVETGEALSYGWWAFVKRIKGRTVFNGYRYSNSTIKHQYKIRRLLAELGVKIDREVQVQEGLQNIDTLTLLNKAENNTLELIAADAERKAERRREIARNRVRFIEATESDRDKAGLHILRDRMPSRYGRSEIVSEAKAKGFRKVWVHIVQETQTT